MQSEDELAIIKTTEAFADAWSRGDARTAASYHTEDAVRVGAYGDIQKGRIEIETAYNKLFHATMPGAKIKQERGIVRFLTRTIALWEGGFEITSSSWTPTKGYAVQVMKKVKGQWLILESHPKLIPSAVRSHN